MPLSHAEVWTIIVLLGIGTFLIRFSFLGLIGGRRIAPWVLRHLRYTPVAVIPGLVMPILIWPEATGGVTDPVRLAAGAAALGLGWLSRSIALGVAGGAAVLVAVRLIGG